MCFAAVEEKKTFNDECRARESHDFIYVLLMRRKKVQRIRCVAKEEEKKEMNKKNEAIYCVFRYIE